MRVSGVISPSPQPHQVTADVSGGTPAGWGCDQGTEPECQQSWASGQLAPPSGGSKASCEVRCIQGLLGAHNPLLGGSRTYYM